MPQTPHKPPLTATDFYKYITCPHWPWFDRFASPEELKLKRALTSGEERRLDDGLSHERDVMNQLLKDQRATELAVSGDSASLFQATLQAMQEGVQIGRVELIDELMIKGSRTLLICFSSWWHHGPTVLTPPGRGFPQPST